MANTSQVIDFLRSKGPNGATFSEIQRFVVEANGRNYDEKDLLGRRINRGYWCDRLGGGFLSQYCSKQGKRYILNSGVITPKPRSIAPKAQVQPSIQPAPVKNQRKVISIKVS